MLKSIPTSRSFQNYDNGLAMENLMQEGRSFSPPSSIHDRAHIRSEEQYWDMYVRSLDDSDAFWLEMAEILHWFKKPTKGCTWHWDTAARHISHTWFHDGELNLSYNCVDRHLKLLGEKTAILWQGEEESDVRRISYRDLHGAVCRFSNVLKGQGIRKGDRVCIYLPMIPEAAVAMLACARIGAIHSVVFAGFSADSLASRLVDSGSRLLITSNVALRGGKRLPLKDVVDEALSKVSGVDKVIVVERLKDVACHMNAERDCWYHTLMETASPECPPEHLNAEDPLFILYTSGSTGQPKGVVHTQGGYLLQAALTHRLVFDVHGDSIYWCTADIGWVTGHSYVVYGPLANGTTTVMFEGAPTYPDPGRFWHIVDKFSVTIFYTAPTAIRALIRLGDEWPKKYNLASLRVLGTVGEPINPEAWMWYYEEIGKKRCPIVDTWWQTETGGIMISALPGAHPTKPGSAGRPFFGVKPMIYKDRDKRCSTNEGGSLCIGRPWPGIMRTMWGDHNRFIDTYFTAFPNTYFTGDSCRIDQEGDYWLMGRLDDVVNVSGHRIGTAEVESALVSHEAVAEAAVVPMPHDIKGQALCAYVTVLEGIHEDDRLRNALIAHVRKAIGPIATPDKVIFAKALPKTRSGKIMRRILRKIASGDTHDLGDTSTLADPSVIDVLLRALLLQ